MVQVLQCHPLEKAPMGSLSGSRPATYNTQWVLVLDDQVDFNAAVVLATEAKGAGFTPLPIRGSFYKFTSPGNFRTDDKSALLLDIDGSQLLDDGKKWILDVRWRAPVPGADEEPDRVNKHPVDRKPYYWIEYYTETEEIFDARSTIPLGDKRTGNLFRPAGPDGAGPITTSAGEEVDLAVDERLHVVLVAERNVFSPLDAMVINNRYFGLLNSKNWTISSFRSAAFPKGFIVLKHHARFLRAETSQYGEWFDAEQYFKMQVRVRVNKFKKFYKEVPNRGTWKYEPLESKVMLHRDDDHVLGKTNLKQDGTVDLSMKPFLIPYQIAGDIPFTRSIGFT